MLWMRQEQTFGNEVVVAEYEIAHHHDMQTDVELLGLKQASAQARGWAGERHGHRLHVWKLYPANAGVPTAPDRVDRYFEIRE